VRDLADGRVRAEGLDVTVLRLPPEAIFARFSSRGEWEASEFSFALYTSLVGHSGEGRERGDEPPVAIPAFPSRVFRHGAFFTRADGPTRLEDLAGARIGIPEWAQTAGVWARGILAEHHGVDLAAVRWRQGGVNIPGREEKAALELPSGIVVEPERDRSLDQLLRDGELDAVITARPPAGALAGELRTVLADPRAAEREYWERSGVFPIMHVVVLRPDFHRANPWAATSLYEGLDAARARSIARMLDATASHAPLPWISDLARDAAAAFGGDLWPYGIEPNRVTIDAFARYAHEQGLTPRRLTAEELFPAAPLPIYV
jgi:4,5-dihydroxyphthalate decarboxylase